MDLLTIKTEFMRKLISRIVTRKIKKAGFENSSFYLENLEITKGEDTDKFVISTTLTMTVDKKDLEDLLKNVDIL